MSTYPTYQAAKIANPDSGILKARDDWEGCQEYIGKFIANKPNPQGGEPYIGKGFFELCDPADYCMTVKQFLENGHKFIEGDLMIGQDGLVFKVSNCLSYNWLLEDDDKRYVLRAKSLEETNTIPTETPEEKEALDAIEKTCRYDRVDSFSFALEADFNAGILFRPNEFAGDGYLKCETEDDVAYAASNEILYRRIEVTERELFIEESCKIVGASIDSDAANDFGKQFDSGKFKLVNGKG